MAAHDDPVTDAQRQRFAAFLVEVLQARQISQKELERRSGGKLPYRTIRAWVTARNLPSRDSLPVLADALQLPLETLMRRSGMVEGDEPQDVSHDLIAALMADVLRHREGINAEAWELFVNMLESVAKMAREYRKAVELETKIFDVANKQKSDFEMPFESSHPAARKKRCKKHEAGRELELVNGKPPDLQ